MLEGAPRLAQMNEAVGRRKLQIRAEWIVNTVFYVGRHRYALNLVERALLYNDYNYSLFQDWPGHRQKTLPAGSFDDVNTPQDFHLFM